MSTLTLKPKYFIETVYEKIDGYHFEQPIEKLNSRSYFEYPYNSYERLNWGKIYWDSKKFNDALDFCKYNSELWDNEIQKQKAFEKIYAFIKNDKRNGSSITHLFPFEIFLMNDGFEMINFCGLNALDTGVTLIAEKQIEAKVMNPKYIKYRRCYQKEDYFIYIAYGIEFNGRKTNFYFQTSKSSYFFQVSNDILDYKKAIDGKLNSLNQAN